MNGWMEDIFLRLKSCFVVVTLKSFFKYLKCLAKPPDFQHCPLLCSCQIVKEEKENVLQLYLMLKAKVFSEILESESVEPPSYPAKRGLIRHW